MPFIDIAAGGARSFADVPSKGSAIIQPMISGMILEDLMI